MVLGKSKLGFWPGLGVNNPAICVHLIEVNSGGKVRVLRSKRIWYGVYRIHILSYPYPPPPSPGQVRKSVKVRARAGSSGSVPLADPCQRTSLCCTFRPFIRSTPDVAAMSMLNAKQDDNLQRPLLKSLITAFDGHLSGAINKVYEY